MKCQLMATVLSLISLPASAQEDRIEAAIINYIDGLVQENFNRGRDSSMQTAFVNFSFSEFQALFDRGGAIYANYGNRAHLLAPSGMMKSGYKGPVLVYAAADCSDGYFEAADLGLELMGPLPRSGREVGTLVKYLITKKAFLEAGVNFTMPVNVFEDMVALDDTNYDLDLETYNRYPPEEWIELNNDLYRLFEEGRISTPMFVTNDRAECGDGGFPLNFEMQAGWDGLYVIPAGIFQACKKEALLSGKPIESVYPGASLSCGWQPVSNSGGDFAQSLIRITGTLTWSAIDADGMRRFGIADITPTKEGEGAQPIPVSEAFAAPL